MRKKVEEEEEEEEEEEGEKIGFFHVTEVLLSTSRRAFNVKSRD